MDDKSDTINPPSEIESALPMLVSGMLDELVPDPHQLANLSEFLKKLYISVHPYRYIFQSGTAYIGCIYRMDRQLLRQK